MKRMVGIPALLGGLFLLNVLLLTPGWVVAGGPGSPWIALEAFLVVGFLALLPRRRWSLAGAAAVAPVTAFIALLAFSDAAARMSLARPLNLYLDVHLARSVFHLLSGNIGWPRTLLAALVVTVLAVGVTLALAFLLTHLLAQSPVRSRRVMGGLLLAFSTLGITGGRVPALASQVAFPVVDLVREQVHFFSRMLGERERFAGEMAMSPSDYGDFPGLLGGLGGRDVVLAFVESYGISALEDPRYAPLIGSRLDDMESRMAAAGLHLATGTLVAPSQGGQSWLGHATVLSGLWLENQLRYDLLLASDRRTLVDDFRRAGYRTVALMPAITMLWPEGERFGYTEIFAHRDIEYRGPALNWVTMPDQFTWSYLETVIRRSPDPRPLFAEVALISSHAPWVPILPVLEDWDAIGDGSIFDPWENAGERPEDLWRDTDRVREHFALSIDYALHALTAYAERFQDDGALLIVMGDHQPAPLITGEEASREVPVHVISGDPALLEPFLAWGFRPGAHPGSDRTAPRMDAFRDWFIRAFSPDPL